MARPVTLFTGQFADIPFEDLCKKAKAWGYDGLELASWGDHFDVFRAAKDKDYCFERRAILEQNGLNVWAFSVHLAGQLVLDHIDARHDAFVPAELAGKPDEMRRWATDFVMAAPQAAENLGVDIVTGFTGSSIWHLLFPFPPMREDMIEAGFQLFAERWNPIFDEFGRHSVKFCLEVHPTEIAYDTFTAERALAAVGNRPEFGFNFDPSHLVWQGLDPVKFIYRFPDRIYHVHIKDSDVTIDGDNSVFSSHLNFGDRRRGWDFRSPGHGMVKFEPIMRALNRINYQGPLSVEWEDNGMDREWGAPDAARFVRQLDFSPSSQAFDAAFSTK